MIVGVAIEGNNTLTAKVSGIQGTGLNVSTKEFKMSKKQNRFYFDKSEKAYNSLTGKVEKDVVNILGINSKNVGTGSLVQDYPFEVADVIKFDDGYESTKEVRLGFRDSDADGVIDNPESFVSVVGEDLDLKYLSLNQRKIIMVQRYIT